MKAGKYETTILSSFSGLLAQKAEVEKIKLQFKKLDKNNDGLLSVEELTHIFKKVNVNDLLHDF